MIYHSLMNSSNGSDPFEESFQYWQVGDRKTFNKLEAILWANGDLDKIYYNFMDRLWDTLDWTQRPKNTDLKQLMIQRCHQLRDQYKEIYVSYSGGYDSQGIVDSFIAAGIPVDGIIVRIKDFKPTEENNLAIQQANALKKTIWPALKIDIRHYHAQDYVNFYNSHKNDWLTAQAGVEPWFPQINAGFIENHNDDYRAVPERFLSKSRCEIYGIEKPRLWIENGNWYACMIDKTLHWIAGSHIEKFYISKDLPELHHARTWGVLDWIESQPLDTVDDVAAFMHAVQSFKLGLHINQQWNAAAGCGSVLNNESYQCGGTKTYHSGSPLKTDLSQDLKKYVSTVDKQAINNWEGQMSDFLTQYNSVIDERDEIKGLWSKKYYIKPVEIKNLSNK